MVYKKIIFGVLFIIICSIITSCIVEKDDANCGALGETIQNDLVIMSPLQATYNQGDVINVKLTIPNQNTFFGGVSRNIFAETGATFGAFYFRMFPVGGLFTGNIITFVSGTHSELYINSGQIGIFNFPLNFNTGNYEFEINITLNRLGNYKLPSGSNSDQIDFNGAKKCNFFIIGTSKLGSNASFNIEFVAQ